jgi:hypothetical protein
MEASTGNVVDSSGVAATLEGAGGEDGIEPTVLDVFDEHELNSEPAGDDEVRKGGAGEVSRAGASRAEAEGGPSTLV